MSIVLVTGGSGFIASHIIRELLGAGHEVRATVRSVKRTIDVRAMLGHIGADTLNRLSFLVADLEHDAGWTDAADGCEYVLHVASPFPAGSPQDENELIVPAREGTLRVLRAATQAAVRRVVLTSSFAAIGYGHPVQPQPFVETSWTNLAAPGLTAYTKSKTIAERAAWDFVAATKGAPELAVVNPVGVFGPAMGTDLSASMQLIQRMLEGRVPGYPRLHFGIVDVRDVAELHLSAMTHPAAKGERFLAVAGDFMSMRDIALTLKNGLGADASKVPTRELPDWLVRLAALINPMAQQAVPELGKLKNASNDKAKRVLGWSPRSREEAILSAAQSLLRLGLVKRA